VSAAERYVPALGLRGLTRFYDPVVALTTRERSFKARLLDQLDPQQGQRILDLACGTGTFVRAIAERQPGATVVGVDGDPEMLDRARAKAPGLEFDEALAQQLPYPDRSFDAVVTSLFLHHLTSDLKQAALNEVARVLKPGGAFHVADWGPPGDRLMATLFLGVRLLDGMGPTRDNATGALPKLFEAAGLGGVEERGSMRTAFGRLVFHSARRAAREHHRQGIPA
jgi:ubiquinone/menaquinone biosynthesis C-methylase UbiE